MKTTIDILLIVLCLVILVQDLRERMIGIVWLALIGLLLITEFILCNGNNYVLLACNVLFISGQLFFLHLYFVHFRKTKHSFFRELLGWGDIVMMFTMALAFPLSQLIIYLLSTFLLGIFFALFSGQKKSTFSIPLAGIMALVFALNLALFDVTGYALIQTFPNE